MGGGIFMDLDTQLDCTADITGNTAVYRGGGIHAYTREYFTVEEDRVTSNTARKFHDIYPPA